MCPYLLQFGSILLYFVNIWPIIVIFYIILTLFFYLNWYLLCRCPGAHLIRSTEPCSGSISLHQTKKISFFKNLMIWFTSRLGLCFANTSLVFTTVICVSQCRSLSRGDISYYVGDIPSPSLPHPLYNTQCYRFAQHSLLSRGVLKGGEAPLYERSEYNCVAIPAAGRVFSVPNGHWAGF